MSAMTRAKWGAVALTSLGTVACDGEPVCNFPSAPSAGAVVYVCPGASGDGSSSSSAKGSLAEALDAASEGATVLLGAGRYEENVVVRRAVTIVGGDVADEGAGANAVLAAPGEHALVVEGATGVVIRGVAVVGAKGTGVWLKNGSDAKLEGVRVEGAQGFGVLATKAQLSVTRSSISNASGTGVQFWDGSSGIIDTNNLTANVGGGVRVDDSTSSMSVPTISNNAITGNGSFGVGVFGALAIIDTNNITGTLKGAVGGYGIVAANYDGDAPSDVTISGNSITGSARAGVYLATGTTAIIDTNNINENGVANKSGAGIWLAGGTNATLMKNTVSKNTFAGVALVGDAKAIIDTNNITGVPESTLSLTSVGDGLFLGPGSTSTVKNNTMSSCYRAGVFTDAANAATSISGNKLSGNDSAMILQGQASLALGENSATMNVSSNAVDLASASVPAGMFGTMSGGLDVPAESALGATP